MNPTRHPASPRAGPDARRREPEGSGAWELRAPAPVLPGLYVHVPFCSRVCPYCDFAVTRGGERGHAAYLRALLAEIRLWGEGVGGERWALPFGTVYFGGGTPSALSLPALGRVTAALGDDLGAAGAWTHFEANPEDVTSETAEGWRELGVDVLSLGVQSLSAEALAFLGRRHDPEAARRSVEIARRAGFATVSVDLIYGLPGQGPDAWRRDLEAAVALRPDHLSCYQLTVEPRTVFGARRRCGELTELPEPEQAELFRLTHRLLADAGYPAYEVSNFARSPGHRSRHNRKYWDHTPYLGLGPSAHSFDGRRRRWWNDRRLAFWRSALERGERPVEAAEELTDADLALERLMLALRTPEGVDLERFRRRYGVDLLAANGPLVERLEAEGLLTLAPPGRLALTLDGLAVADGLASRFDLPPAG